MTFLSSVLFVRTMICPSAVHLPLRHLVFKTNRKKNNVSNFFCGKYTDSSNSNSFAKVLGKTQGCWEKTIK